MAVFTVFALSGCAPSPQDRMAELDRVYGQGKAARAQMITKGQTADEQSCAKVFVSLGEDQYTEGGDKTRIPAGFVELRRSYYHNGCLGLPKPAGDAPPSSPTMTVATPSAS